MKKIFIVILLATISNTLFGQEIFKALENQDYTSLEQILKQGESTEIYNSKGLTPVWLAVFKNDTTALNLLIQYDADLNFKEKNGLHPIMIGAISDSYESVKILLDNGVDVNWKSKASRNQQPIRFASQGGSLKLVKLLLDHGADMESTPDDRGTPLLAALHAKKFEIAEFYFKKGVDVNVIGRDGETIVHEAIKSGNPKMVELALENNAPLDYKDPNGKSTLQLAKQSGNSEIKSMIKEALSSK